MFTRTLKLICAASMLMVIGACDGGALTGPEDEAAAPLNRTACMAGGEVAIRAGCPNLNDEEVPGDGVLDPVGDDIDDCGPTFGASLSKQRRC